MSKNKIRVVVIDNEPDALTRMKYILDKFPELEVNGCFTDPNEGIRAVTKLKPDMVFVDIEMPGKTGFEVVREIRQATCEPYFVFVTAYNQYAVKAIKAGAFDFLLKPVDIDECKEMLARYSQNHPPASKAAHQPTQAANPSKKRIRLNSRTGFLVADLANIFYCEADGAYTKIFLTDGKMLHASTYLADVEKLLPQTDFIRISRFHLINLNFLSEFDRKNKQVLLSHAENTEKLTVSRVYFDNFKNI